MDKPLKEKIRKILALENRYLINKYLDLICNDEARQGNVKGVKLILRVMGKQRGIK